MREQFSTVFVLLMIATPISFLMLARPVSAHAQEGGAKKSVSREEFLMSKVKFKGKLIGQEICKMMVSFAKLRS